MVALAASHAQEFAERASTYDSENRFVTENFDTMRRSRLLAATVPAEFGGLGVESLHDVTVSVSRIARGCPATALALNMHLGSAWTLARMWRGRKETAGSAETDGGKVMEGMLRLLGRGRLIMAHAATEPGTTLMFPKTRARRVEGGYLVTGRKTFVTNSEIADLIAVFLTVPGPSGDHNGTAIIRRDTPGLSIAPTWDAMGMRGSGSHDVVLTDCLVPDMAMRIGPPVGELRPEDWIGLLAVNYPLTGAYLGIAEAALQTAVDAARSRRRPPSDEPAAGHPLVQTQIADIELELTAARAVVGRVGSGIDAALMAEDSPGGDTVIQLIRDFQCAKLIANRVAVTAVDRSMGVVGGRSYLSGHPLARLYRDARAGGFMQPFAPEEAREFIGRVGLGLDPFDGRPSRATSASSVPDSP
jgi:alkylation response protein AidB-like acyl-CoA dehydrogenase